MPDFQRMDVNKIRGGGGGGKDGNKGFIKGVLYEAPKM